MKNPIFFLLLVSFIGTVYAYSTMPNLKTGISCDIDYASSSNQSNTNNLTGIQVSPTLIFGYQLFSFSPLFEIGVNCYSLSDWENNDNLNNIKRISGFFKIDFQIKPSFKYQEVVPFFQFGWGIDKFFDGYYNDGDRHSLEKSGISNIFDIGFGIQKDIFQCMLKMNWSNDKFFENLDYQYNIMSFGISLGILY